MAGGANFAVDLEASAKCGVVECLDELLVFPWILCCVETVRDVPSVLMPHRATLYIFLTLLQPVS